METKPTNCWVLHDPDLAEAILDRILELGCHIQLQGPSYRTRHHHKKKYLPEPNDAPGARISGRGGAGFPELTPPRVNHYGVTLVTLVKGNWFAELIKMILAIHTKEVGNGES